MKARNINGTSDKDCVCGSWLKHWENLSSKAATSCSASSCSRIDLVGAHVQKEGTKDNSWFIIPLCTLHNGQHGKVVDVKAGTTFVSANKNETCEPPVEVAKHPYI
jgi:hypothetical protein